MGEPAGHTIIPAGSRRVWPEAKTTYGLTLAYLPSKSKYHHGPIPWETQRSIKVICIKDLHNEGADADAAKRFADLQIKAPSSCLHLLPFALTERLSVISYSEKVKPQAMTLGVGT